MKYPVSADQTIAFLETETGEKMDSFNKTLWTEVMVPLANESYEQGESGLPLNSYDWIKCWEELYGTAPYPRMASLLNLIAQFEKSMYEEGRKAAMGVKQA